MYQGEFKDNIINGKGSFPMKSVVFYIIMFTNRLMNGKWALIYKNKEKYVGNFKDNKKDGEWYLFDSEGNIKKFGIWEKDKLASSDV